MLIAAGLRRALIDVVAPAGGNCHEPTGGSSPTMSGARHITGVALIGSEPFPAPQRLLAGCLLASVVLHALVFVLLPGWVQQPMTPPVPILEVTVVAAGSQAEPASPTRSLPPAEAMPRRVDVQRPLLRDAESRGPAPMGLPQTSVAAEPALVPAHAEPPRAAPDALSLPAPRADPVTPPAFNAAYLRNPSPGYPLAARRSGDQGTVTLKVLVSAEGAPVRVELDQSSGSGSLDGAALDAVKGWRFVPARRGVQNVEAWVRVPIVFRLES